MHRYQCRQPRLPVPGSLPCILATPGRLAIACHSKAATKTIEWRERPGYKPNRSTGGRGKNAASKRWAEGRVKREKADAVAHSQQQHQGDDREQPEKSKRALERRERALKKKAAAAEAQKMSLQQALVAAGVDSRRKCEKMITDGRVKVDGTVITRPPHRITPGKELLRVDNVGISTRQRRHYLMVHKPKGYVCSTERGAGAATKPVTELLEPFLRKWREQHPVGATEPRWITVGALDRNSTGLLVITNDGKWAQEVAKPTSRISKEYLAKLDKVPTAQQLTRLAEGCTIDGRFIQPEFVGGAAQDAAQAKARIVVRDASARDVKDLIEHVGRQCKQLRRVRIGALTMPPSLRMGGCVEMKQFEVKRVTNVGRANDALYFKLERQATSGQSKENERAFQKKLQRDKQAIASAKLRTAAHRRKPASKAGKAASGAALQSVR